MVAPFSIEGASSNPGAVQFLRLVSLELSAQEDGSIAWETTTIVGGAFRWAAGLATVTPADLDFGFGGGGVTQLTEAQKLQLLLGGIGRHLATEEPEAARQTWVGLNPFSLVSHEDWRSIAARIEAELPDLAAGKQSSILNPDGTFTLPTRGNLSAFLLPEPTAVPEPATLALLGLGIAGLAMTRRRAARPRWRTLAGAAA